MAQGVGAGFTTAMKQVKTDLQRSMLDMTNINLPSMALAGASTYNTTLNFSPQNVYVDNNQRMEQLVREIGFYMDTKK